MNTIQLKNGSTEVEPMVIITMAALLDLINADPIAFYELTMKCRNSAHVFWGG